MDEVAQRVEAATRLIAEAAGSLASVGGALDALNDALNELLEQLREGPEPEPEPEPPAITFPGQVVPRHYRIKGFWAEGATRVYPGSGATLAEVAAAVGPGGFVRLEPGVHVISDVRCLKDQYFLGVEGSEKTIVRGDGYGFRAKDPGADGVTIGGITVEGFCKGSTNALAAAISPRWSDTLFRTGEQDWYGGQPKRWTVHDSVLRGMGVCPNGFSMGNNGAAIRTKAVGYMKTGIGLDRTTGGGLVEDCKLWGNGLKPNKAEYEDGADLKAVFANGLLGVSQVEPIQYIMDEDELLIIRTDFRAKDPETGLGGGFLGFWADLDTQFFRVAQCSFRDYQWGGAVIELSSRGIVEGNLFEDCAGYGPPNGVDFRIGALTIAESCHVVARWNRFVRCGYPLVIRQSYRDDMLREARNQYDINYANPKNKALNRWWIDNEDRKANVPGGMSNLATAEIDILENVFDGGQIILPGGSRQATQDAFRNLLTSIRFRGNKYDPSVRLWEMASGPYTPSQWQGLGRTTGRLRDQS